MCPVTGGSYRAPELPCAWPHRGWTPLGWHMGSQMRADTGEQGWPPSSVAAFHLPLWQCFFFYQQPGNSSNPNPTFKWPAQHPSWDTWFKVSLLGFSVALRTQHQHGNAFSPTRKRHKEWDGSTLTFLVKYANAVVFWLQISMGRVDVSFNNRESA